MKDAVRLAAWRTLMADLLSADSGEPEAINPMFVRLVEAGTSVRSLCAATGWPKAEVLSTLVSMTKPPTS